MSPRAQLTASTQDCDLAPPSAPGTLNAVGAVGRATLTWAAATDNVGVDHYNVHRGTSAGFTPALGNRIAQPTGTSYTDVVAAGTYFYKVIAEDASNNAGPASNEASAVVVADTVAPTAPTGLSAVGGPQQAALNWTAATDNVGVVRYNVHRGSSPGFTPPPRTGLHSRQARATRTRPPAGIYYYRVTAEDAAGNVGPVSNEATATVTNPPPVGLVAAYGFDEGSGTTAADAIRGGTPARSQAESAGRSASSGLQRPSTASTTWSPSPDCKSLDLTTAMTLEAWVLPSTTTGWRTAIFKDGTGDLVYGLYSNTNTNVPRAEAVIGGTSRNAVGTALLRQPVVASRDDLRRREPAALRQRLARPNDGRDREHHDFDRSAPDRRQHHLLGVVRRQDRRGPRVQPRAHADGAPDGHELAGLPTTSRRRRSSARLPAGGSIDIPIGVQPTARFSEPIDQATLSAFELRDATNALVPATVSYDEMTATATLVPSAALTYGGTYTATIKGGILGLKDRAGNPLAADRVWTFSVEAIPPPILVIGSTANPFTMYATEILKAEGLNNFSTLDISLVSPTVLSYYQVAILGDTPLTPIQVTTLTNWVTGGGNLIALRPDKQLAGLLGVTDAASTLSNAYLAVNTSTAPGRGHRRPDDPVPRHRRPLHAERRHVHRDALLERDDGDRQPCRDAPLRRLERRRGSGVRLRPQPLDRLHAPG